ncbi:tRNA (cytidine(34)-2'-O)-methyltransferase [Candidatus Hepatincola sp. Av]
MVSIALFEPDIPQNTGTILRTADCLGVHVDIIEPCGFIFGGGHMRRAAMDYLHSVDYKLHDNFQAFLAYYKNYPSSRLILATTKASTSYTNFNFQNNDIILFGKESMGVPECVHNIADSSITIKMLAGKRSLNLAVSCGIIIAEALRQTQAI